MKGNGYGEHAIKVKFTIYTDQLTFTHSFIQRILMKLITCFWHGCQCNRQDKVLMMLYGAFQWKSRT